MSDFESLSNSRRQEVQHLLSGLDSQTLDAVADVCALSDFFYRHLTRDPAEIALLFSSGDMDATYSEQVFADRLKALTLDNLDTALRTTRQREMCRIIFRDLTRRAGLAETVRDLSNLADASIETALSLHYQANCQRLGVPVGAESGEQQYMTVLALGKLGAGELNLSSDIDLVFFYGEAGEVEGPRRLANQEFFVRTSRAVIASLDRVDPSGFVFRCDMRLRPYGDSGALILARSAMEKYFIEQGRDWERYAFIKARACAGDIRQGEDFLRWLTPFVYRKHLDFGAIDALREMKRLINYEVEVKSLQSDLKLGHGGIREIEFVVQACQIVWGGNDPRFRGQGLMPMLTRLGEANLIPTADVARLQHAYEFLRNSEHVIQAEADRQTQRLPVSPLSRMRLAVGMGFGDFDAYMAELDRQRAAVSESFTSFMSSNSAEEEVMVESNLFWVTIWQDPAAPASVRLLEGAGFTDASATAARLVEFEKQLDRADIQEIGAGRLDRLMPILLSLVVREQRPDETLERLLAIMSSIARRSTYIAYLLENVDALKKTVALCAMSPWVAEQLKAFPILLYELADRVTEDVVFGYDQLHEELLQLTRNVEPSDLEGQMDSLRQFRHSAVLKVAVFELLDLLPLMKASDALTYIAEIVLHRAFEVAWGYLADRHGEPCDRDGTPVGRSFAVIAYGKLGGIELGYGSDLDVVFLHDADIHGKTRGARSVDNGVFYARLGQRIVHILTSFTRLGSLYEIDLRLRPDGNKGPLVSTFNAYERYLLEKAWTWEHQALVRARFVAGNSFYQSRFEAIRERVLARPRERSKLLLDVVAMREKMRQHLEKPPLKTAEDTGDEVLVSGFDLKHGAGAMIDIEFMVQYVVLGWSSEHWVLTKWTDKMRILDEIRALGIFAARDVDLLQDAYLAYRSAVHYQRLGGEVYSFDRLNHLRTEVVEVWNRYMTTS